MITCGHYMQRGRVCRGPGPGTLPAAGAPRLPCPPRSALSKVESLLSLLAALCGLGFHSVRVANTRDFLLLLLFNVESEPVYKLYVKQVFPNFRNVPFRVELFQSHSFSYCVISFHFGLKPNRKWPVKAGDKLIYETLVGFLPP